jgi:pectinesterase
MRSRAPSHARVAISLLLPLVSQCDVTLRVFADGTGDFASVQAAIDSVARTPGAGHATLQLRGVFRERVSVWANLSSGVDFVQAPSAADRPLIIYNVSGAGGSSCNGTGGPGTFGSFTVQVLADDVRMRGVDVANDACGYDHKAAGQSVALDIRSDRFAFFSASLLGSQDTLYTGRANTYFADLFINGTCDAVFGNSNAVFERATIRMDFTVTAQRGPPPPNRTAYLFLNSSVDSLSGAPLLLGRPWGPDAMTIFSGCELGAGIDPAGWSDWSHNCTTAPTSWCADVYYAEFNNTGPGWQPKSRVPWAKILDDAEGESWTVERVLGAWKPSPP